MNVPPGSGCIAAVIASCELAELPGGGGAEGVCQLTPTTAGALLLLPLLAVTE